MSWDSADEYFIRVAVVGFFLLLMEWVILIKLVKGLLAVVIAVSTLCFACLGGLRVEGLRP